MQIGWISRESDAYCVKLAQPTRKLTSCHGFVSMQMQWNGLWQPGAAEPHLSFPS